MAGQNLQAMDEGRRRQSSNFFDILTDPQRYHEQVQNFVNENFDEEDEQIRKNSMLEVVEEKPLTSLFNNQLQID